ncbi:hypothetical protein XENORESO_018746, partial [Xenotaenia resolanae]
AVRAAAKPDRTHAGVGGFPSLAWSHWMARLDPKEDQSSDGDGIPAEKRSPQETRWWLRLLRMWMARLRLLQMKRTEQRLPQMWMAGDDGAYGARRKQLEMARGEWSGFGLVCSL